MTLNDLGHFALIILLSQILFVLARPGSKTKLLGNEQSYTHISLEMYRIRVTPVSGDIITFVRLFRLIRRGSLKKERQTG